MDITISSTYIGGTYLYKAMMGASTVFVEVNDNYNRQTFRTRTLIAGANGVEALTIPIVKPQEKTKVKDILIDGLEWQTQHWRAIESAYNSSPFLEYYADDLIPFYTKPYKYLCDFNFELQQKLASLLGLQCNFEFTKEWSPARENDFRFLVEKKAPIPTSLHAQPYYQVFKSRFGFIPHLSALDLLLNEGPEAIIKLNER